MGRLSRFVLFTAAVAIPAAFGQSTPLTCNTAATPHTIRAGGLHERTADLVVTCTGGFPTGDGTVPPARIEVIMSANAAGRFLNAPWSEALLIVGEPGPASQLPCATANGTCTMSGNGVNTYDGSPGQFNVFQAQRTGNRYVWPVVPFDAPGAGRSRIFRFTNLKVDAGSLTFGLVTATVDIGGQIFVSLLNPTRTVANVQTPLQLGAPVAQGAAGQLTGFTLSALESFGTVFRTRSTAGTGAADQNEPGLVYPGSETGFRNSAFPGISQRGELSLAGLADTGTRVRVTLNNMPTAIAVNAPLTIANGAARLVTVDAAGSGVYTPATSTLLPNPNGTVAATYEVVTANPFNLETFTFSFTFTTAPGVPVPPLPQVNGTVALVPQPTPNTTPQPSFHPAAVLAFQVNAPTGPALSITTQALPNGFLGIPYSQTVQASGGTTPYSFGIVQGGVIPPGLTFSAAGLLTGVPTTPGRYSFTVRVTDAAQSTATRPYTLDIAATPPQLSAAPRALEFTAFHLGGPPPVQAIVITSAADRVPFRVRTDAGEGTQPPAWLLVLPPKGTTPARLVAAVEQRTLSPGDYSARILVTDPTGAVVLETITVRLRVVTEPPLLRVLPEIIRLQTRAGQPEKRREHLALRNAGGGGPIAVTLSVRNRSPWITGVTPADTAANPWPPRVIVIDIDTVGLAEGFYRDVIRVVSSTRTVEVPIVLWVTPNAPLLDLSDHGLTFTSRQGERNPVVKRVRVLNRFPNTTLQWRAEAVLGGDWLAISPASGQATTDNPATVRFGLRPEVANLPAGRRYALVRVSDDGALHSPRFIVIVLRIIGSGDPPLLDFDAGGIVLTSSVDGGRATRDLQLRTTSTTALAYSLSAAHEESNRDGDDWLTVTPLTGSLDVNTTGAPGTITITADPTGLSAGIYRGQVVGSAGGRIYALNVTFIVTPADTPDDPDSAPPDSAKKDATRSAGCVPQKLALAQTALVDNFNVPAGWPASLSVELRNDCGATVQNGAVVAIFSNGDPPLALANEGGNSGLYSATWQPGYVTPQMNVTIRANAAGLEEASAAMVGGVDENKPPVLFPNGTIHINYHPVEIGGPLAPGMPAEMYGQALAGTASPTQVPLPRDFQGTSVLIGPQEAPLFYISPEQVNIQVPWELTPNRRYSVLVLANGEPTLPDFVDVVPLKPGITNTRNDARELIAQHTSDFSLVTASNPAKRGEFLVMYLAGLGATTPAVASGALSPVPPALPNKPVQLTIGGITANVQFAGMTPGAIGLFQINFVVPDNVPLNTPLDVVVKQDGVESNVTRLTVAP